MDCIGQVLSNEMGPPSTEGSGGAAPHVRRLKTLRRGREEKEFTRKEVKLETVLGVTVASNASLATAPGTGVIAYPAGCTVVLYNCDNDQQQHIVNIGKKTITSVGWSEDGRYLATGESGHLPCVRVWDTQDMSSVVELSGHKFGINCVAFSPKKKYIVSVGTQHDMIVNVWDWRTGTKVASNKVSAKVEAVSFAENGSYFVTAGNRHVKFWYLECQRSAKLKNAVPLLGRSAILGEQRNNNFCDVACGKGQMADCTYAITQSGLLVQFNNQRLLDKWVELKTESASCLSVGEEYILIGCAGGVVRCFSPHTLQFVTTLPRPHALGVDVAQGLAASDEMCNSTEPAFPDARAVSYDEENAKVTVIYNDHSLYVWDVRNVRQVGKICSFLFHSACIWGVDVNDDNSTGSFVTCSSDDTIRIWSLNNKLSAKSLNLKKVYKSELMKIVYIDPALTFIKADSSRQDSLLDQKNGVRCLSISPDGEHLASGDRSGNIRVHSLQSMKELCRIEAHDAEVLSLQYSQARGSAASYLASASRDRLIHVFDVKKNYEFLSTLDDHSSSITAVRFLPTDDEGGLQMVSCGADKSIIFRNVKTDKDGISLPRANHIVGKTTLYDMEVDRAGKQILTACQDRNIRVYGVGEAKQTRVLRGSASEDGSLIKVVLDRTGTYYATSCTDKTVAVYDYRTGDLMATLAGHSELVTGLVFSLACHHLISVSGDSCVFVWRLPEHMVAIMQGKLDVFAPDMQDTCSAIDDTSNLDIDKEEFGSPPPELLDADAFEVPDDAAYRFSVGKLPAWAKTKVAATDFPPPPPAISQSKLGDVPKGRWANKQVEGPGSWYFPPSVSDVVITEDETEDFKTPRRTLFDDDTTRMIDVDEKVNEFKVNAMDVEALRQSQRKLKVCGNESVNDNEHNEEGTIEENDFDISSKDCDAANSVCMDGAIQDDERFLQSNFESLSHEESRIFLKTSTISNAWREGNTPVQLKRQTRNLQKMMVDNKLNSWKGSQSRENLSSSPAQLPKFDPKLASELSTRSTQVSPVSNKPELEQKPLLQKSSSLLDISNINSPPNKKLSSFLRRGSGDSELPTGKISRTLNKYDNLGNKESPTIVSKLEQHKKMLADVKRDRLETQKNASNLQQVKKAILNQEVPNYMRSTLAKSKKERVNTVHDDQRKKCSDQQAVLERKLKRVDSSEELDSEEEIGTSINGVLHSRRISIESKEGLVSTMGACDVSKAPLSDELIKSCAANVQAVSDQLVLVYKRVSLDDDLDDSLRTELLSELSAGASQAAATLRLVYDGDDRSQGEIATAAMATINQFLAKQSNLEQYPMSANKVQQNLVENHLLQARDQIRDCDQPNSAYRQ
eukprot:GFUD01018496.1.p1 GENE.GFUD01018496.1~~GFUD01018496.1.p1  ORF type:complete len:1358 (+),score=414.33 GFUD01018496.1:48-4121(+)